jgi:hypothetical protein
VSVAIEVQLQGATNGAKLDFGRAVQAYAELLAAESQAQEISNRPPGTMSVEVAANSVVRAKTVFERWGQRGKPLRSETAALIGLPVFSGATGVLGSYFNSPLQVAAFSAATHR